MSLIPNWKAVLAGSWSVRLMVLAALVSMAGVFFSMVTAAQLGWNPVWFAVVASVINVLAIPARLVVQTRLTMLKNFLTDTSGAVRRRTMGGMATGAVVIAMATPFIAKWEGVKTEAYLDIVGVPTICFGDTNGVQLGDTATMAECVDRLEEDVQTFYAEISPCMTNKHIPMGVQASMLELAFNVGSGPVCRSTMMRKANSGDYVGACNELRRWVKAGGQRIRGLENRRADSKHALCLVGLT
ncbi:lysozyme [Leisingera sp. ANG-Vp]|uniref:lysozyme n=1 Tax=Leisingera sp. ANG-Vp TaxID=1577896 RepID=UPI000B0CEB08|nr:lysozyme [Leisingera sp. ANG-Vp]